MKCQILFSGKNKKNIINLSSAENAQRVVKVNIVFEIVKVLAVFAKTFEVLQDGCQSDRNFLQDRRKIYRTDKFWFHLITT